MHTRNTPSPSANRHDVMIHTSNPAPGTQHGKWVEHCHSRCCGLCACARCVLRLAPPRLERVAQTLECGKQQQSKSRQSRKHTPTMWRAVCVCVRARACVCVCVWHPRTRRFCEMVLWSENTRRSRCGTSESFTSFKQKRCRVLRSAGANRHPRTPVHPRGLEKNGR